MILIDTSGSLYLEFKRPNLEISLSSISKTKKTDNGHFFFEFILSKPLNLRLKLRFERQFWGPSLIQVNIEFGSCRLEFLKQ